MSVSAHLPFETVTVGTVFSGGTLLALLALLIRQIGPWRKQTTEASDVLIKQLNEALATERQRIDRLEDTLLRERRLAFIQLRRVEARHDAQRAADRHKFSNSEACLDALLNILELSPEKAPEAARRAREKRSKDRANEHLESTAINAAEMAAVADAERELAAGDKGEAQ